MVDGSGSIGDLFTGQLQLVTKIVDKLGGISSSNVHASVILVSTSPVLEIGLRDYLTNNAFKKAVSNVSSITEWALLYD